MSVSNLIPIVGGMALSGAFGYAIVKTHLPKSDDEAIEAKRNRLRSIMYKAVGGSAVAVGLAVTALSSGYTAKDTSPQISESQPTSPSSP